MESFAFDWLYIRMNLIDYIQGWRFDLLCTKMNLIDYVQGPYLPKI